MTADPLAIVARRKEGGREEGREGGREGGREEEVRNE
jgi:hypothetical protein